MKKVFCIFLVIISANFVFGGTGSAGAQFLQIGGGARAQGMGSAFVGYADGLDAIYWNPAGLMTIANKTHVGFNHLEYFAEMSYENFALSIPFLDGVLGFSGIGLLSGDIEITTVDNQEGTGEKYEANDFAVGISYARSMTEKFAIGVTLKLVNQNLDDVSATGFSMDIGATYSTGLLRNLRFGFAILNFGPDLKYQGDDLEFRTKVYTEEEAQDADARARYVTEEYQLPLRLQLGMAMDLVDMDGHKIVLSLDGINPSDQSETFGLGMEYNFNNMFALRAGYTDVNYKGFSAGATGGIGDINDLNMLVNYGFENHQYLGEMHRFGVEFVF